MFALKNVNYKDIIKYPDISIPENVATFICGESGSGKSTLLKLLNGVLSPSDGEVIYLDRALEEYESILLRQEILLVGQSVYLFDVSIKDNFIEYYNYRSLDVPGDDDIKKYLDICAVNLPLDSMCHVLSGGERQRVFIAINLSYGPRVLMMDEPTSALDDKNANALMENIKAHCKANGITLIVVSHDKTIADKYADNVIDISGGGLAGE